LVLIKGDLFLSTPLSTLLIIELIYNLTHYYYCCINAATIIGVHVYGWMHSLLILHLVVQRQLWYDHSITLSIMAIAVNACWNYYERMR